MTRHGPPESSRRRVAALFIATAVYTVGDGSVTLLLPPYLDERGLRPGLIGLVVATYSVASLITRILSGTLYRADLLWLTTMVGIGASALSFLLIPRTSNLAALIALSAMNGAGAAIASTSGMAAVMEFRPSANSGVLMGWYTGFISGGYAISGFLGGALGDRMGPGPAIMTLAVIPVVVAVALGAILRGLRGVARPSRRPSLRVYRELEPFVWLAFFIAIHINLLSSVMNTYFPLYGLAVGLSLTRVGILFGVHSSLGSAVRFISALIFRHVHYRGTLPWLVALGGLSVAATVTFSSYQVLLLAFGLLGLARALLRVASSAVVMDFTNVDAGDRGAASSIYLAGLDVGKIIGPLGGGLAVGLVGIPTTIVLAGTVLPLAFIVALVVLGKHDERR